MSLIFNRPSKTAVMLSLLVYVFAGCQSGEADRWIKADIILKAKDDINFAGLHYLVADKKVIIWGNCPDVQARSKVMETLGTIKVIDSVDNRIQLGTVILDRQLRTQRQLDSVLADYPAVAAVLKGSSISLIGRVNQKDVEKIVRSTSEIAMSRPETSQLRIIR